ncbi:hypothetical protein AH04_249 [Erwinia phage AH04]|uniref:Uncharacterized protein n=1 Tax=Erwinia phage AH04 TaxID=2869569 RepID=A0AAE7X2P9_9CAUD|nr:hypothetical protein PQC02_gp065 [Erwinia phage AH04]QZA70722.1 hypothetical protein AH04_249 [Erwinia phage AH04]
MSQSDIEHFATMISGCESITSGRALTDDGRYAFSVLKIHAEDTGCFAGQEGFLDTIKKGAKKTGKWIMDMIIAFIGWITDEKGRLDKIDKEYRAKEEDYKANKAKYDELFSKISDQLTDIAKRELDDRCDTGIDRLNELLNKINNNAFYADGGVPKELVNLIDGIIYDIKDLKRHAGFKETLSHIYFSNDLLKILGHITKDAESVAVWLKRDVNKYRSKEDEYDASLIRDIVTTVTSVYNDLRVGVNNVKVETNRTIASNMFRTNELKDKLS